MVQISVMHEKQMFFHLSDNNFPTVPHIDSFRRVNHLTTHQIDILTVCGMPTYMFFDGRLVVGGDGSLNEIDVAAIGVDDDDVGCFALTRGQALCEVQRKSVLETNPERFVYSLMNRSRLLHSYA